MKVAGEDTEPLKQTANLPKLYLQGVGVQEEAGEGEREKERQKTRNKAMLWCNIPKVK